MQGGAEWLVHIKLICISSMCMKLLHLCCCLRDAQVIHLQETLLARGFVRLHPIQACTRRSKAVLC